MKYRTIVVDPPWEYRQRWSTGKGGMNGMYGRKGEKRGAAANYACLPPAEIAAIPIDEWAEPNAHLYVWVTNAFMEEAHVLVREWGFEQKTILTWIKNRIGTGFYYRNTTEHVLFCVRGSLAALRHKTPTHFFAPRGRHSEKPAAFYDLVETMSPGPYLDVFARVQRFVTHGPHAGEKWGTWGNEAFTAPGLPEPGGR